MSEKRSWIEITADAVEKYAAELKGPNQKIICASGISPSGTIHLGNLREIITVHLVSEEIKRRGLPAEHIHSWDDFDRLRKVPSNVPMSFQQHVGKPLSDIPDPYDEYASFALRFMTEFENAVSELGINPRYIRQSIAYRRGDYRDQIKIAMSKRLEIFDILAEYQTLEQEKSIDERRYEYYPFRVYCESCHRDTTNTLVYEEAISEITYSCLECNYTGKFSLSNKVEGKLVWKADWPMRWSFENVDFEPAGEDHSAPGSSFTVGQKIVSRIFGGRPPYFIGYAFVGMSGRTKISSSAGTTATPRAALDIMEPAIIRWLYVRKQPNQKFSIDFGKEIYRVYDEWDTFVSKTRNINVDNTEKYVLDMCTSTSSKDVFYSQNPVSFRLLASAADITHGNEAQILRIASEHLDKASKKQFINDEIKVRLRCAVNWATNYQPEDERTIIRDIFNEAFYSSLDDKYKNGIEMLIQRIDNDWTLEGITTSVYGIPKLILGYAIDHEPNEQIKSAQREFFKILYMLICQNETGPRLPTLFISVGKDKIKQLLISLN